MSRKLSLPLIKLPHARGLDLPIYATTGAAGFDLPAAVAANAPLMLAPMQRRLVPTGLCFALPPGYEMQIRPRSGLSFRHGITVLNAPGTIDSDYRGEVKVLLVNLGQENFIISRGMRIAQALIAPILQAQFRLETKLDSTERGGGGFGSTGKY